MNLIRLILILLFISLSHSKDELSLAMSGAFQPFSTTDSQGQLTGLDAEIAIALARAMGKNPKLIQIDWSGIQAGLQAKKYDLICASMAITKPRRQTMEFSLPYYVSGAQIFAKEGLSDLKGIRVGVTEDSTYANWIRDNPNHIPQAKTLVFGSEAEIVVAMEADKVDGFISDRIVGGFYASKSSLNIVPFGSLLYEEECGIAARKGSAELIREVNQALLTLIQTGEYQKIYRKWVGSDPDLRTLFKSWGLQAENIPSINSSTQKKEKAPEFVNSAWQMIPLLLQGLLLTVFLTVVTLFFSLIAGVLLGIGSVSKNPMILGFSRSYTYVVRGTPLLVQLFFSYFVVTSFINQVISQEVLGAISAALIALVCNTTAYNAETFRGGIQSVASGQWQAAYALGMRRAQVLRFIVLPQAFKSSIPSLTNNLVVLIKDTSLVGAITLVELTYAARSIVFQTGQAILPFLLAASMYLGLIAFVIWICQKIESRL